MPKFVKIEKGIVDKDIFDQHVPAHIEYIRSLNLCGHQAQTGYWGDFGGGMLIFEATDMIEAQEIIANDPLIKNECVSYELHEWKIVVDFQEDLIKEEDIIFEPLSDDPNIITF